jgi:ferredoxin
MEGGPVSTVLAIDPIACDGHGLCADLLPELVALDEWGYPVLRRRDVPPELVGAARRAAGVCPKLALLLATADQ